MSRISDRNKRLNALFESNIGGEEALEEPGRPAPRSSGAIRSMDMSLSQIEQENERLRTELRGNNRIVELNPDQLTPSFVVDRFAQSLEGPALAELVASIRENGQQIPILVRPDPAKNGSYQIAYGHRRWRACQQIGRPVRAIIADLDDRQLVIAQGKENAEREDLSFIEQAVFAATLKAAKFPREIIAAALAVPETNVSKMNVIAAAIPRAVIDEIGPAPKVGRPRWEALAEACKKSPDKVTKLLSELSKTGKWQNAESDARFGLLQSALDERRSKEDTEIAGEGGSVAVRVKQGARSTQFVVGGAADDGFAAFLIERMPALIAAFEREKDKHG